MPKVLGEQGKLKHLRKALKVVIGFAAVGFIVPWLLLAYYTIAQRTGHNPSTTPALYMCPFSIYSLALDNASLLEGLFVWLVISLFNASLYAMPGLLVGAVVGAVNLWKSG
jgi:Sec-independent protein secretion pathway component TatC